MKSPDSNYKPFVVAVYGYIMWFTT